MSNEVLLPILESVKDAKGKRAYCCIKQWLITHRHVQTGKLAKAWNVSHRTISGWRRKLKTGECICERNEHCKLYKN